MATAWYVFLALMLTAYAVLDGFDLGVGALHRLLPRGEREREEAVGAIGPIWDGNEVWLIAAGGVLFLAFPLAYAAAFSGLYLGMILLLWLLIGRALGLELRHQLDHPLWHSICDTVFWLSSALLALVFGIALGNVLRGVPLGEDGYFQLSLFELLNSYAVLIGVLAIVVLAGHGASFLAAFTSGGLAARAGRWAARIWWAELGILAAAAYATSTVRDELLTTFADHPWRLAFPALAVAALAAVYVWLRAGAWIRAFGASCAFVGAALMTTAAALYPDLVPARESGAFSLTVHNAASGDRALRTALFWWPVGIALAVAYFTLAYRHLLLRRLDPIGRRTTP
jgi:cytochrome d ubiquinol oxidase subunit II